MKKSHLLIILAAFAIVVYAVLAYPFLAKSIEIKDKCGSVYGNVLHSVADQDNCESRCIIQCVELGYKKSEFTFTSGGEGCNSCACICRKALWN